ncbi:MAG TPA: GtrA family protein [Saprospiraceae bacterium]|nr:GtrA family protein [Saprospiraceae bacterium]
MKKGYTQNIVAHQRPSLRKSFVRAQIVSMAATTSDFIASILLYQLLGVYYVTSTFLGALLGAYTSFTLGRNWAFLNKQGNLSRQAIKFVLTNSFSLFANTAGVFLFKENFNVTFIESRFIVAILVGILFNFFVNRYFVFR